MSTSVRVPRDLWDNPEWRDLTPRAQLVAMTCMALGKTGSCSTTRVARRTGWGRDFITIARAELETSPFAHVLVGIEKRRVLPASLVQAVKDRDGWACVLCQSTQRLEIDHIYPVSRGGSDDMENLQTLCQPCNRRKGAKVDAMVQG